MLSDLAQAMKRARLESQGRASSSHAPTVALSSGDRPGSGVEPPGATSDLTDTSESQSAGSRAFVCDLWKHKNCPTKTFVPCATGLQFMVSTKICIQQCDLKVEGPKN